MTRERRRRPSGLGALLVASLVVCCGGDTATYSPARDAAAMAAIASAWSETAVGGLELSLCEDVAAGEAWTGPDCTTDHAVRGGGLGLAHTVEHGGGCGGGCTYQVTAAVQGTVTSASLGGAVAVTGFVALAGGMANDPYGYPYRLLLLCEDPAAPCAVTGTLGADGRIEATLRRGAVDDPGATFTRHVLLRIDAAVCR